ncbi:MAG: 1-(5-phosphoribosyl)-5-[(5-phosphoribosylamino)methylideneamino]imidazole-4-carboxamide isomerase [Desulfobacterales bacterium]|nr:1-(5-phosphoribosyl)-5-[(5-phosphoribosylamino)methylideneamino]imidazole-4-carboxamide isomerase [Desulfobacterales bacterium]
MIVIPAVDIKDGKCVRLLQGRMEDETVFSDDPVSMAKKWAGDGTELLHVVDLNGAFDKTPKNLDTIRDIVEQTDVPVQVGGGIRNEDTVKIYMDIGVNKVVIGTEAIHNPDFVKTVCRTFPGQIVVGIDARNGFVAVDGWTKTTEVKAVDLARRFEDCGVAAINFTDIHRDGMQTGPNIEATRDLASAIFIPVVASGGVSTLDDIRNLLSIEASGVIGVITGRALYSGTLDLKEAIKLCQEDGKKDN